VVERPQGKPTRVLVLALYGASGAHGLGTQIVFSWSTPP